MENQGQQKRSNKMNNNQRRRAQGEEKVSEGGTKGSTVDPKMKLKSLKLEVLEMPSRPRVHHEAQEVTLDVFVWIC